MDKLGKSVGTTEKSKTAKSESDLLKTNEDIAPQRRELQTLVWWGAQTPRTPHPTPYIWT